MQIKGFVMAELLIVILITSLMILISLPNIKEVNYDDYLFGNNYLLSMSDSLVSHLYKEMDNKYSLNVSYPIYFTKNGNVNQAQTIIGKYHRLIIHIGNGYLSYE